MAKRRIFRRRGAILPLTAIMLVSLFAMVAFSVDFGYIIAVRKEMQKAADSAALAGASRLLVSQLPNQSDPDGRAAAAVNNAVSEAMLFCSKNRAANSNLSLLRGDVTVGHLVNPTNAGESIEPWASGLAFPNTVQVTVRRDNCANGPLALFFARIIGNPTWTGQVTATATAARSYTVTGFNSPTKNGLLLPIAVSETMWSNFLRSGLSADGQRHDDYTADRPTSSASAPANVTWGGDGTPEFTDVYPNKTAPGNFGLLCIGPPASDTPTFQTWITDGQSPADMAYFGSNGLQATKDFPRDITGGPGLKSPVQRDLQDIIGKPRIICLYSTYQDNGSNASYRITGFAGITLVKAESNGTNMQIVIQPMMVIDPTATVSETSWTPSTQLIYPTSPLALLR